MESEDVYRNAYFIYLFIYNMSVDVTSLSIHLTHKWSFALQYAFFSFFQQLPDA